MQDDRSDRPRAKPRGRRARAAIKKGARVRVLEGPFSGKVGTVQELDGKGGARVMLGLLPVWVHVRDLGHAAPGHGRPLLPVSHRKPGKPAPIRS